MSISSDFLLQTSQVIAENKQLHLLFGWTAMCYQK